MSQAGYQENERVVLLEWHREEIPQIENTEVIIRPMNLGDMKLIHRIDDSAFVPLWKNSLNTLGVAYRQAAMASVAEVDDVPVGYQISTATPVGGHLARLAVLPEFQSQGIGYSLVRDTLVHFYRRGAERVTVNTQQGNSTSIAMYEKAGFKATGESFPVYLLSFEKF